MRIRKRTLKRIIAEVAGGTITLDTKEEVMAAIKGQDIEITMGGMGPAIVVQGGPTYMVDNAFEDIFASYDYNGDAVVRGLESVARSVHVDDELKAELGMDEDY